MLPKGEKKREKRRRNANVSAERDKKGQLAFEISEIICKREETREKKEKKRKQEKERKRKRKKKRK